VHFDLEEVIDELWSHERELGNGRDRWIEEEDNKQNEGK
jgi:hypothetical protein